MSTKDEFKVIEFDIDTTNPRKVSILIICKDHDLAGTDLLDAIEHLFNEIVGKTSSSRALAEAPDDDERH